VSFKLELDADSIKKAITSHISNQGFDLAGKTVEVALVNGRGGNGNRATIIISDDDTITEVEAFPTQPTAIKQVKQETALVVEDIDDYIKTDVQDTSQVTETPEEIPIIEVDPIVAAAENSSDPFGEDSNPDDVMEDFFPSVNPSEVGTSKSLF